MGPLIIFGFMMVAALHHTVQEDLVQMEAILNSLYQHQRWFGRGMV
jgi:hypothetical protein